ncbi:hypothetical protein E2C01_090907 [Portunus trituberculatus]|uniref:Uncharacterized protein n=1 Tax=Portunus trituberculatus TaxID=210409 RepID=A0A5B7JM51_PORTR|nr:hypothetical protein [Portunus trituberculatus]
MALMSHETCLNMFTGAADMSTAGRGRTGVQRRDDGRCKGGEVWWRSRGMKVCCVVDDAATCCSAHLACVCLFPQRSAVVTRLVYDSVSLLSHLLRANVGAVHLRRQPAGATNLTGEELRPRDGAKALRRRRAGGDGKMPRPRHPGSQRERGFFQGFPRLGTKSRRSRSPRGRGARAGGEPREEEEERERERLYFEMKTLDKAREDEEFERRLESIIGSRRISSPVGDASWVREGSRNRSRAVEMRIKQPTSFPGMQGRGAVAPSGERSFDFLLLDWLPSSGQLSVVLALQAAPPGVAKVG